MMAKTVVLIDDDPDDLDVMKEAIALVDPTFLCISFIYPEEAVQLICDELVLLPDYIFIDINMPRKNGPECLQDFRNIRELNNVPIIILSTSLQEKVSKELMTAGANFTFQKPYSISGYSEILTQIFKS